MVAITPISVVWFTALILLSCFGGTESARNFDRRSDLDVPPINVSAAGWTVPLQGSKTCMASGVCRDALTQPPLGKPLQYLAIARGLYVFYCRGDGPNEVAEFQSQSAQLYNVAPLVPRLPSEQAFHSLVPQIYDYDYMQLRNSSLECMGTIGTVNDTAVVTLFDIATFQAHLFESVLAPNDPEKNGRWAHSVSPERSWDIYRVEVAGGIPPICGDEELVFEKEYAAEYWFFHWGGEDLWTSIDHGDDADETLENAKASI